MAALGNLPGVGKQAIVGDSETSELNELAGRLIPVKSLKPSHGNLRKLSIGASAISPQLDVSLVGSYGLHGLKSLTLHGSAIEGAFEVFTSLLALEELDVGNTNVDCSRALELVSSAQWAPQIKKLGFCSTNVQGDLTVLGKSTNLEIADFRRCGDITGDLAALAKCTKLVSANFRMCHEITGSFEAFTNLLALQELNVTCTMIDCSRALELITSAPWAPQILEIGLSSNVLGDIAALRTCTNLVNASLFYCSGITGDIAALGNCTSLKDADFGCCFGIAGMCLGILLSQLVSPSHYAIAYASLSDIAALGNFSRLETVDFSDCSKIIGNIAALGNFHNLKRANFRGCLNITGTLTGALARLISNIRAKDGRDAVVLSGCGRFDLAEDISDIADITHIDVSEINLHGSFEVFTNLLALQELDVSYTNVDCLRALELISSAPWTPQIKKLELAESDIQGDIAVLGKCTTLEKINFHGCENIAGDIAAFENCTNLEEVNFDSCNGITGDIAALGNCVNLKEVDFTGCKNMTGNIAALGNGTSLKTANFSGCTGIAGDVTALANRTKLRFFDFRDCTGITGLVCE